MGYAKQGQNTKGIHIRQYSRAFVFEENGARNVFVSIDIGMMGQLVKMKVNLCEKLRRFTATEILRQIKLISQF